MHVFSRRKNKLLIAALIIGLLTTVENLYLQELFTIGQKTLDEVEKKYGQASRNRLIAWENLVRQDKSTSTIEKLEKVNSFFNNINFVNDIDHWGKKDYWATPIEFLASDGGDCEDFSVAKYFTLISMGIPEQKLYLTYVKALRLDQAHMVLAYYSEPGGEPLILDNLTDAIKPASQRSDLLPVYSFNGSGLWIAKQRGRGKFVSESDRLKRWRELLERMPKPN